MLKAIPAYSNAWKVTWNKLVDLDVHRLSHCLQALVGSRTSSQNLLSSATWRLVHSDWESGGTVKIMPGLNSRKRLVRAIADFCFNTFKMKNSMMEWINTALVLVCCEKNIELAFLQAWFTLFHCPASMQDSAWGCTSERLNEMPRCTASRGLSVGMESIIPGLNTINSIKKNINLLIYLFTILSSLRYSRMQCAEHASQFIVCMFMDLNCQGTLASA